MMKAIMPEALPELTRAPIARRRRDGGKIGAVGRLSIFAGSRRLAGPRGEVPGTARERFRLEAQHHLLSLIAVDDQALEVEWFLGRLIGRARHRRPLVHRDRPRNNAAPESHPPRAMPGIPRNLWTSLLISSG